MHSSITVRVFVEDVVASDCNVDLYRNSIKFFVDTLFNGVIIDRPTTIKVTLQAGTSTDEYMADCEGEAWEDEDSSPTSARRVICVTVNTLNNTLEVVSTIAHELIHAKQYITNDLRVDDDSNWFWKGKLYGKNPYTGDDEVDSQLPWEYHAYGNDVKLAKKFTANYYNNW